MGCFWCIIYAEGKNMRDEEQLYKEFDQLIGRHRRLIRFLCQRASYGREANCRDLIQECYVAMLKHLPGREPDQSGRREFWWVYWQCRSAIDCYRRKMQRIIEVPLNGEFADTRPAASEVTRLTVDELAACLDGKERIFFLLMADGADDEELGQVLGLKHRSVVQMRHNIKKKLQKYIEQ